MICPTHKTEMKEFTYNAGSLRTILVCEQCTIDKENEAEEKRKIDQSKQELLSFQKMNIEPKYYKSTFDNFNCTTEELSKNKEIIVSLTKKKSGQILLLGKNGTGKTHLGIAALKILSGRIYTMYEISTMIRATYTVKANETELQLVNKLANYPLLVIDEVGRTKGSDSEENWLSYIIDKRLNRYLPTILISNNHMKKKCEKNGCPKCLENYFGEDVISRLREDGKVLNFTGEDFRAKRLI